MTTTASQVPLLEAREAMPNLFLKLEQVILLATRIDFPCGFPSDKFVLSQMPKTQIRRAIKLHSRSARMMLIQSPIRNQSTRQVRVHMKAIMNSQTLMMKMRRDPTRKAVLVTLKKISVTQRNQGILGRIHLGRRDTLSDI